MQYQLMIIQANGETIETFDVRSETFRAAEGAQHLPVVCGSILQEILPKLIRGPIRVSVELPGYPGLTMQWEQSGLFTASVLFSSNRVPVGQCWFLSGCESVTDALEVDRIVRWLQSIQPEPGQGERIGRALRALEERPAVFYVPLTCDRSQLPEHIGELVFCLAIQVFAVAAGFAAEFTATAGSRFGGESKLSRTPSWN